MDVTQFPYLGAIPLIMVPFLQRWVDPVADGNCGFRVVAEFCDGDPGLWCVFFSDFFVVVNSFACVTPIDYLFLFFLVQTGLGLDLRLQTRSQLFRTYTPQSMKAMICNSMSTVSDGQADVVTPTIGC